eukprot:264319-Prymnesium_polylepis.1
MLTTRSACVASATNPPFHSAGAELPRLQQKPQLERLCEMKVTIVKAKNISAIGQETTTKVATIPRPCLIVS